MPVRGLRDGAMRLIAVAQLAYVIVDSAFAFVPPDLAWGNPWSSTPYRSKQDGRDRWTLAAA